MVLCFYFCFSGILSPGDCCDKCAANKACNVWVYCPKPGGCDNGYGTIYPYQLCSLKYQELVEDEKPSQYASGPGVEWISGVAKNSSLGQCFGAVEALATAEAQGCGSTAYASALALATSTCGEQLSAYASSLAIGGSCPLSCDQAIEYMRGAAGQYGCDSNQYNLSLIHI